MVQVAICGCRKLECPEANIIKSFVINAECLVRVLHKLMNREGRVVGLKFSHINKSQHKKKH